MDPHIRDWLAHLCYVAVLGIVGLIAVAIGVANRGNEAAGIVGLIGGWCLVGAVIYLLVTLVRLAAVLRQSESSD